MDFLIKTMQHEEDMVDHIQEATDYLNSVHISKEQTEMRFEIQKEITKLEGKKRKLALKVFQQAKREKIIPYKAEFNPDNEGHEVDVDPPLDIKIGLWCCAYQWFTLRLSDSGRLTSNHEAK